MHDIFATVCEFFRTSGPTGLFWNSFIESFFLVPPPDILLGMMTLSEPQKAVYFATLCTLASALGGIVGYFIGYFGGRPIFNFFFRNNHSQFEKVEAFYDKYGSAAVFFAAFTPIPYKVIAVGTGLVAAESVMNTGASGTLNIFNFVLVSLVGRGLRFFIEAILISLGGDKMEKTVKHYIDVIGWACVALIAIFIVYKVFA